MGRRPAELVGSGPDAVVTVLSVGRAALAEYSKSHSYDEGTVESADFAQFLERYGEEDLLEYFRREFLPEYRRGGLPQWQEWLRAPPGWTFTLVELWPTPWTIQINPGGVVRVLS